MHLLKIKIISINLAPNFADTTVDRLLQIKLPRSDLDVGETPDGESSYFGCSPGKFFWGAMRKLDQHQEKQPEKSSTSPNNN